MTSISASLRGTSRNLLRFVISRPRSFPARALAPRSQFLLHAIHSLQQLRQPLKDGDRPQPHAIIETGRAGDHLSPERHVVAYCRLRGQDWHAVADGAVAGDAGLAGKDHVVADDGGAGQAGLCANQGVFSYFGPVADLDQVVHLAAVADLGGAYGCAVDAWHWPGRLHDCPAGQDRIGESSPNGLAHFWRIRSRRRRRLHRFRASRGRPARSSRERRHGRGRNRCRNRPERWGKALRGAAAWRGLRGERYAAPQRDIRAPICAPSPILRRSGRLRPWGECRERKPAAGRRGPVPWKRPSRGSECAAWPR